MPQVTITLEGPFINRAIDVDGHAIPLGGGGGGPQSATIVLGKGQHTLTWSVQGEPEATYSVTLSGSTDDYTESFKFIADGPHAGSDNGYQDFVVN